MKRILVGIRNGRAVTNWPAVALFGLVVGTAAGAGLTATWYLLTGEFSLTSSVLPIPFAIGFFAGEAVLLKVPGNRPV